MDSTFTSCANCASSSSVRFRRAFESLEQDRLIEPASGMNGTNGFLVLTPEGREAVKTPVNLETVRMRNLLKPEMLHPKTARKAFQRLCRWRAHLRHCGGVQDP